MVVLLIVVSYRRKKIRTVAFPAEGYAIQGMRSVSPSPLIIHYRALEIFFCSDMVNTPQLQLFYSRTGPIVDEFSCTGPVTLLQTSIYIPK